MKKILSLIIVICILLNPVSIYANNPTYISPNDWILYNIESVQSNLIPYIKADDGVRLVCIKSGSYLYRYGVTLTQNLKFYMQDYNSNTSSYTNYVEYTCNDTTTINNITYYYKQMQRINDNSDNRNMVIPIKDKIDTSLDTAIYYTFGDGALGSEPVQNWGLLNIRFNTDIAGSGDRAGENLDNISWTSWDSNGNYIGDKKIEIRAVPGYYEANDRPSLLQMHFINWVKNSNLSVQVFKGSIIPEHRSFTWNYITELFSSIKTWEGRFWSIFASDNYWYQYGWIYEARILDTDDIPLSEWQEIVTGTASSPKDTEIIETSDELTPELYNVIYNINVYNDYQENWQINNTTINMQPDETLENDKPWWVVLLEGILSILDKLLEMLMKLFIPENLTLPDFTNQTNQYMNNTGIFGQSIQFINDTHTTFQSIQNADPVISVPAITYDNTTFIPAQSWNLNTLVNDYGLSDLHNMVYLVTDGFVYIGLIILIRRKVIEVLKK